MPSAASATPRAGSRPSARRCAPPRTTWRPASSSCGRPRAGRARSARADDVVVCPFKGLASFEIEDAEFFFGRERLVAELVARLTGAPLTGIVGPSGSGKSSVLRAGLLAGARGRRAARQRALADRAAATRRAPAERARAGARRGRARGPAGRRRRPVRGALHGLPRRGRARGVRRRARRLRARSAPARARARRDPGRLLRALRGLPGAGAAARRQPRARRPDAPRRAAPRDRAAARSAPAWRSSPSSSTRCSPTSRASPERCRCCPPRCSSSGSTATGGACASAPTSTPAACTARSRGSPSARTSGSTRSGRQVARRILLRLAGEGEGDAVVRRRVPLAELERAGRRRYRGARGAGRRPPGHDRRGRGRGRARGAAARVAAAARLAGRGRAGTPAAPAPARGRARMGRGRPRSGRALPRRAAGRRARVESRHAEELNATEREFLAASRAASERSQRRLRALLAGLARAARARGRGGRRRARAARQRPRRGDRGRCAAASAEASVSARALVEDDLDLSLLLARQGVALDDSPQTRGNLLAALLRSPAAIGVLRGDGDRLIALDLSPDERTLAFIDNDGTLSFVDTAHAAPGGSIGHRPRARGHHHRLRDQARPPALQPRRLTARRRRRQAGRPGRPHPSRARAAAARGAIGFIYALRFSPDGRTLLAAIADPV